MHFAANQALFLRENVNFWSSNGQTPSQISKSPPSLPPAAAPPARRRPLLPLPWPPALGIAPAGRDSKNVLFQNDNVMQKRPFFSSVKPPTKFCPAFCPASFPLAFPPQFFFFWPPPPPPPPPSTVHETHPPWARTLGRAPGPRPNPPLCNWRGLALGALKPSAVAYGHTTGNTPEPVRFQKLSPVRPS